MRAKAANIILITIDVLRYDHLGCYGYPRDTSPNIDGLAARGVKFLQAISNGGQTPESFPSILASALPPLKPPWGKTILRPNTMLAELLKGAGYKTAGFHSNPYLSRFYGYDRGFDTFDDRLRGPSVRGVRLWLRAKNPPDTRLGKIQRELGAKIRGILRHVTERPIVNASETTDKAIDWLKDNRGKFFLWLHYLDVHHPYLPAAKYLRLFHNQRVSRQEMFALSHKMSFKPDKLSSAEVEKIISLYDAEIRYVDEAIGVLLNKLKDYLANTFIILTADHGDEFGEHGRFGHQTVYDETLRVPLIIAGPGIKGGTSIKEQVSLIDLAPTIAEFAGIKSARSFQGKSLLPQIEGKKEAKVGTISTLVDPRGGQKNIAYRTPNYKYILTESLDESEIVLAEEVYELKNDPGETKNLHNEGGEEINRFELEAKRNIAGFKKLKAEEATTYEKQKIKAKLTKLSRL